MLKKWNLPLDLESARKVQVFSGGACNILDADGKLIRNQERDEINDWISEKNILLFDPQIHPDSHGVEYDYETHAPLEAAARKVAIINLFEVSPRTFGGVTSLEIAIEEFREEHPTIIFFSDGNHSLDIIPAHTRDGYPLFAPYGIRDNESNMRAHYNEMIKNANRMRQYLMRFADQLPALTVSFGNETFQGDIVISPRRMHAVELFTAVTQAASGKRTNVNFTGGEEARDPKGYPLFIAPEEPRLLDLHLYLDQYVDEANLLRRAICELVHINVFVRVVYTQKTSIAALDSLLRYKKLIE